MQFLVPYINVAVDKAGNEIVAASYFGVVDFGGGPLASPSTDPNNPQLALAVAKMDQTGKHVWSKVFGTTTSSVVAGGVGVDDAGNIVVIASQAGAVDFGGGSMDGGAGATMLLKLDASGAHVWSKVFKGPSLTAYSALAVSDAGDIVAAQRLNGTVDFGGGPLTGTGKSIFLAKLDAQGQHTWSETLGVLDPRFAMNGQGELAFAGSVNGTVDLGGGPLTGQTTFSSAYAGKLDASCACPSSAHP